MDPSYSYETRSSDGVAAYHLSPSVGYAQRSSDGTSKPFISTNRNSTSKSAVERVFNNELDSDILKSLEGFNSIQRGSRTKPSVMKYPEEVGSGEVPHVMQFKIFWRWENKDMIDKMNKMKAEAEKVLPGLGTLTDLISQENLSPENIEQSGLPSEQIAALKEILGNKDVVKTVDPTLNDTLANLLSTNPNRAKVILEETIKSYQNRLGNIQTELANGAGKIGLDLAEKLLLGDRLNEAIPATGIFESLITGGGVGGVLGAALGGLLGGGKGAAMGAGLGAAAGGLLGGGAVAFAKMYQNQAIYDQMISIYLPYCTKINNEDTFQYEESSQIAAGAFFDALGRPLTSASQGIQVGIQKGLDYIGAKDAGAIASGKVVNPRLEKLFKQKDFRNFNFAWEFYPKNKKEVNQIREIIETFRYHAHPATDDQAQLSENERRVQIILRVPAEFEIRFLSTNPYPQSSGFLENEYLPKIGRCALTSISIDYTPNSIYSSFVDNSPTAITMSLQFTEMGILTRESVDKGY